MFKPKTFKPTTLLTRTTKKPTALMAMAAAVIAANSSYAQELLVLEEILVTAQKRQQNALEVPITVDNFSSSDIANTGSLVVGDIADYIPGFETESGVTQNPLTIRGVTSSNISVGGDPSVATFYDDVYLPQAASTVAFVDMARVEVLKGPQGTLFGRNASAGVVNLVPNQPGSEQEGYVWARVGTENRLRLEGMANLVLGDSVFLRASVLHNQKDGYIDNIAGRSPGEEDNQAARLALRWRISDSTDVQLSYDYDKVDNAPRMAAGISAFALSQDPFASKLANDVIDGEETRDMDAVTFKLMHQFNDAWSMKWVSSYRDWQTTNREEEDGTAQPLVYADINNEEDSDIFYNELQFSFKNERFDWVFGANFSEEDVKQRTTLSLLADSVASVATPLVNNALGSAMSHIWNPVEYSQALNNAGLGALCGGVCSPATLTDFAYDGLGIPAVFGPSYAGTPWGEYIENTGDFKNWGVYTDVDITVTERWNVLLGLRYSKDEKDFSWYSPTTSFAQVRPGVSNIIFNDDPSNGIFIPNDSLIKASDEWSKVTGRAVVRYAISDSASTFLSYSTGYKSGGFDSVDGRSILDPFEPEESTNYEWGIKGDFFDSSLRTQLSIYRLEIDDRQKSVNELPPGQVVATPRIINGDQTQDGVELTVDWLAIDTVRLGLVTTYRDEESTFENHYNEVGQLQSGKETGSADMTYTASVDWTPAIANGSLLVHVDYIYKESSLADEENYDPAYEAIDHYDDDQQFLNTRIVWFSDSGQYEVALWGKNLLDNQYVDQPGGRTKDFFGTVFTSVNEGLHWGADVKINF